MFSNTLIDLISIIAFIMSSLTWIVSAYQHSIRLSIKCIDYRVLKGSILQMFLYIQNNSSRPITITGLALRIDNQLYPCELLSKIIRKENGNVTRYTPNFPLNLSDQQGVMYFFEFLNCQEIVSSLDKTVEIQIYSNRGHLDKYLSPVQSCLLFRPN